MEYILMFGIPTAITGLLVWFLKRHIDQTEQRRLDHDKNVEQMILMIMQTSRANYVLTTATAKAVQRIPDAHCNGDMTAALQEAAEIQEKEKDFVMNHGVEHIFGHQ